MPESKPRKHRGLIALVIVLLVPVAMCAPLCVMSVPAGVGSDTVLELDLEAPLDEVAATGPMSFLSSEGKTLMDVELALERAKTDPKVRGIVARVGSGQTLATVQELREAVLSFRASGKPAIAWAESFGEMTPGVGAYTLASAFDEIWLQPSGDVGLTGMFGEAMFMRGALDKLGVEPEMSGRKEYKNAVNQYTETTFTAPHKEATVRMLQSMQDQIIDDIAASRPKLGDKSAVQKLLEAGPLSAQEALAQGLVDKLGYKDEVMASLHARFGPDVKRLWVQRYVERAGGLYKDAGGAPVIALVVAKGPVTRGKNGFDPLSGSQSFGSDTVGAAVHAAAHDDAVKAIVLRVDSPGGSYVASDSIWRAVREARSRGKIVIASMGDLAASGGYFVSMGADKIVADRATLTGSIGVFAGKLVTARMWDKIGVNFEAVMADDDVDPSYFSDDMHYSDRAKAALEKTLDRIYLDFTTKAAEGRKMPLDKLEPLAHGRVWTGADGKERGLVDELGGFMRALEVAREAVGLKKDADIRLRVFPKERPALEELLAAVRGEPGDNSDDPAALATDLRASPALARIRTLLETAAAVDGDVLHAPLLPRLP